MSNVRPFIKNTPPTSPGYPGRLKPPVNSALNAWSGPVWRNPANPLQVKPPPTRLPPKLPPKLPPVPKGPGLGLLSFLKPNLPSLLLFTALFLLTWWLSQPPPPENTGARPLPTISYSPTATAADYQNTTIAKAIYRIYVRLFSPYGDGYGSPIPGDPIIGRIGGVANVNGMLCIVHDDGNIVGDSGYTWDQASGYGQRAPYISAIELMHLPPDYRPPVPPPPPYTLGPSPGPNAPPLINPDPKNPTPTNPVPLGNPPGKAPSFNPFPGPGKKGAGSGPDSPDEKEKPPWFSPFPPPYSPFKDPFPFNPTETSTTTGPYVKNDPVINFGPSKAPDPLTHPKPAPDPTPSPKPIPDPDTKPKPDPNPTPDPDTKPKPDPNPKPDPTPPPDPNKDKNVIPFFPPFPVVNPKDPTVKEPEPPKPPVIQTPTSSNCCVPGPVDQKLNDANKKLDDLTPLLQTIDLSILNVINNKLGPQISGGLSGYLQDRFTKLWKSRVVDRTLNLMATAASIHNAVMLSRNIGSTLISTLGNALNIIGIKDGDEVAQNFSTVIGDGIENIIKGLIGAENYTALSETWAKANRIYQSAINVYQLMTDSLFGITEGLEQTAKYTGKIGNALRKSGVVLENSYNWMSEQFDFSSGKNRKIARLLDGLGTANEIASDLESITSEFRNVTENVAAIGTEIDTIKTEIGGKEESKKGEETKSKDSSQSPAINKSDLIKPS